MLHPSKQTLDQLNLLQKDFTWRGRRPKIKHSTLIGDYTNGEDKDVDIERKFESSKIIPIRRLLDSSFPTWKAIPQCLLSKIGIQSIFHSNFKPSEFWQQNIALYPKFSQGIISFWENASIKEPVNLREITSQTVCNNCYILRQASTIFYSQLCYKGIHYVRDILHDHGKFLDWQSARIKFYLHDKDIMAWLSLIKSIPVEWKREIEAIDQEIGPAHYGNVLSIMTVKNVHNRILQSLIKQPTSQEKIESLLGSLSIDWPQIYMIPQKVTIDSSLKNFSV